jgi:hypothetical protein
MMVVEFRTSQLTPISLGRVMPRVVCRWLRAA